MSAATTFLKRVSCSGQLTRLGLLFFFFVAFIGIYFVRHHVFFWDTIQLGSKHAHFYYDHHFRQWLLPEAIDSGHPPIFGMYIAAMWGLFGKTLPVSHFAMLPFLWGIVYFLWQLGTHIAGRRQAIFLMLLAIVDPTLAAQSILISPDLVLVCFFLMGIFAILQDRRWLKVAAMLGLAMISMRGMMTVAALFVFEMVLHFSSWRTLPAQILQKITAYLPAGLFGFTFLTWHYTQTGWIGYHADSPWAPSFARVDEKGFFKNIAVLGWRMLDFGRIFVWIVLLYLLLRRNLPPIKTIRPFILLFIVCAIILVPTLLFYQGLNAHRYLLPIYLSLSLLVFALLFAGSLPRKASLVCFLLIFVGLSSGNCWIYPDKISQGWDATLAHVPYYQVRSEMLHFIQAKNISFDSIGTAFPEIGPQKYRDLSGSELGFQEKNFSTQPYILYSNVMNDFTDAEIDLLQAHWLPLQTFKKQGIRMILYQKK